MTAPISPRSHLVIVPSYNTGALLEKTVREILTYWLPVWVVIDGSTDGSERYLAPLQEQYPAALRVIKLSQNVGKGAAILQTVEMAQAQGFSHVLTMDADQQHDPKSIPAFMQYSIHHPDAMILGEPVFDGTAPALRVYGRKLSNLMAHLQTLGGSIHDALFGMRVYPIQALIDVMYSTSWARRFDFEPEVAVRLAWANTPAINIPTPVRYITKAEGGVSQFRYFRDNCLLTWMNLRLLCGFIVHLPRLIVRKFVHR